jgi:hypothetical protein
MGISTRNLEALPNLVQLKRLLQSLAMLDAILMPEWQYRYYSFNAHWGHGEMMGAMRNGQGNELFALFNMHGAFLKGFVHESGAAFYRDLPVQFEPYPREPAFSPDDVMFCVWRFIDQPRWSCSKVNLPANGIDTARGPHSGALKASALRGRNPRLSTRTGASGSPRPEGKRPVKLRPVPPACAASVSTRSCTYATTSSESSISLLPFRSEAHREELR